ncbi:CHAT domain-containing protein [Lyngbya sp. PCC 8106]|uniref:nSTAND1 domain-containing NTPase n=1 Tax=Lyngbya sp. (strain PCC 8106) TaxID=313612 RepID=UPI0000EADAB7|nr:CHAT domain-containing protein [Lyngbya sp. PCC 8106]EAW36442.1 WD-40 repeat protein [Lyngbya sp. PCC 8106]
MTKLVTLKLDGDLQQGVRVTFSIANEGASPHQEVTGNLPPIEQLQTKIDQWRSNYRSLGSSTRALKAKKVSYSGSITHKYKDCKNSAHALQKQLNNWLHSESFRPIRETWLKELQQKESVRVLVRTSSQQLRQIPWHLWDLLEEYPQAELALSATNYQKPITAKTPTYREKVKILAILGNSRGIDVETDRSLLNSLPDAEVTFLVQPRRQEINDSLWSKHWDILFFAGHSQTVGDSGRIYINENQEYLTIDDLKYGLRQAVNNGLALAIFNSCDGLGLVSELEALQIPQIIVMREPVPDEAAQVFLKHFLLGFANVGQPLYQAVKEARLKLHGLEDKYPCASWLPVIYQNAGTTPPCWLDLGRRPTKISPYRGLFAFREEDAHLFFGRESLIKMLVEAVQHQPLVAVIGSSGSGKSSVVFAGLVNRLRNAGNWQIVDFRPGSRPLFALATALVSQKETHLSRAERLRSIRNLAADLKDCENGLRDVIDDILCVDPNQRLLLIADQFEELYTLCRDTQERNVFLDRLLSAIYNCRNFSFVITLRADFLGQALSYRPFADALQYADLKLGSMTHSELQDAVEKPAALLGVTIEQGLTERIVSAVSAEPGDLPLLEFALTQLWAKQQDARLTHAAYEEIGGVEAALAHFADEAYQQLNFEEQERAQRIFIQLVHPGEGTEDTRRIATRGEVGEENWALVTRLADARLVVTGYDEKTSSETVEIVHEALIRRWGKLQQWMQQDRDFRYWQEQLRAAMRTWESSNCDEGALLRGKPLFDAEDWYSKRFLELSSDEKCFIKLSGELKKCESKKQKRRRQLTIWGLSGGLVVALSLAGVAGWQWQNAIISQITTTSASSEALFASHQELEALTAAIRSGQQLRKLPWVKTDTRTTVINTLQNLLYRIKNYNHLEGHRSGVQTVAFRPDGEMMATVSWDGTVKFWQPDGSLLNRPWLNNLKNISAVAFSPDSKIIATASGKTVTLWNLNGKMLNRLEGHKYTVVALAFSPDSQIIATASGDAASGQGAVQLWRQDGTLLKTLEDQKNSNLDFQLTVAFSPDGKMIASGGWHGALRLWKKDGTSITHTLLGADAINTVSFSPNSQIIATGTANGSVYIHQVDGTLATTFSGDKDGVWGVSFSPNGEIIATAGSDRTVKLWKLDGTLVNTLQGHRNVVLAVAFSRQGSMIASASDDGTIKLWKPNQPPMPALKPGSQIYAVRFSPDGRQIATTSGYGTVTLWNREGTLLKTGEWHDGPVVGIDFSPEGQIIATASGDQYVRLWKSDGILIKPLERHSGKFVGVSFSPDSQVIAAASDDGTVKLWKRQASGEFSSRPDTTLSGHTQAVRAVAFSPEGQIIATASDDQTVKLWKREAAGEFSSRPNNTLTGHTQAVRAVAFSPDGEIIAAASNDQTIKLWKRQASGEFSSRPHNTLTGHTQAVRAVAFSPDGEIIATASNDQTIKLWKTDGTLIKTLTGHRDAVSAIAFSPDGKTLASASKDKTVILWNWQENLGIERLLELGCDWVRDYLKTNPNMSDRDKRLCDGMGDHK